MIDVKYRRLMLSMPKEVLQSVLSHKQRMIAMYVHMASSPVLSGQVADAFNITISNAGMVLKKLVEKGYLKRLRVIQLSGGFEFEYTPAFVIGGDVREQQMHM